MYWLTGLLGLAFATAPFIFGYSDNTVALWTSVLLGVTTALVSYIERITEDTGQWEYVVAEIAGLSAVAAPFVFGFKNVIEALWASVIIGVLLMVVAGSKLYEQTSFR